MSAMFLAADENIGHFRPCMIELKLNQKVSNRFTEIEVILAVHV